MGKLLKKIKELAAVFAVSAALCAVPVMAGGFCDYGTDEPDDECSLNWAYNEQQHWCYCMVHEDENGEAPITYGPEPHTYDEEGRCKCGIMQEVASETLDGNSGNGESVKTEDEKSAAEAKEAARETIVTYIARSVSYLIRMIASLFR